MWWYRLVRNLGVGKVFSVFFLVVGDKIGLVGFGMGGFRGFYMEGVRWRWWSAVAVLRSSSDIVTDIVVCVGTYPNCCWRCLFDRL